jgi:hypothetical protein
MLEERTLDTMKDFDYIRLPRSTYQCLLEHLSLHSATDSWAESLLKELQQEVKPVAPCGSIIFVRGLLLIDRLDEHKESTL